MTTISSNDEILSALKLWSSEGKLQQAKLSDDGLFLELDGTKLENKSLSIATSEGKTLDYSLGSVFLQILDPNQNLVKYRNACKQHNVSDPVKSIDKTTLVGYFSSATTDSAAPAVPLAAPPEANEAAAEAAEATAATAIVEPSPAATTTTDREKPSGTSEARRSSNERERKDRHHHHKSKRDRDHHRSKDKKRDRSSSKKDHHRSSEPQSKKQKKKPEEVTNEELFSNLNVVVNKRTTTADLDDTQSQRHEISEALSAEGFDVTPELLAQHRETAQQIFDHEIPVGNSASILRAANPRKDLSRVLQIFNETVNPHKSSSKKGGRPAPPPKPKTSNSGGNQRAYLVGKKPVIVVPNGMTAPITLANAQEFFSNGLFLTRDKAIQQGKAAARGAKVSFSRNVRVSTGSGPVEYEILDAPKKLGTDKREWERIVAVVALGKDWQFKDWADGYNNPVELFARTFGFFVSMDGDRVPKEVTSWSVKQCKLSRDKRGLDSVTFASFWNGLDNWMTVNRRELLPQTQDH